MATLNKINIFLAQPLIWLVTGYQKTISPDHGLLKSLHPQGYCHFYPSCSEYARLSLRKSGLTALPAIVIRIIKCGPWTAPAVDLP